MQRLATCHLLALLVATLPTVGHAGPADGSTPEGGTSISAPQALAVAERVLVALGGRAAWEETRFVTWNFFGRRRHVWDKWTGDLRVEGVGREDGVPYLILMNLGSGQGRAWQGGQELGGETLAKMLENGRGAWINDSYWMFMPYKLLDPGVRLGYAGEGPTSDGAVAEILELTFTDVGLTPENKYRVYVGRESHLVEQWDYFERASDAEPSLSTPWRNWRSYGRILLSDDRGERRHTGLAVFDELPAAVLASPEPVDWAALGAGE